jgi:hypothetical protein
MTRGVAPITNIVLSVVLTAPAWAQPPPPLGAGRPAEAFLGYWMGVDPLDGGDSRRSLVRLSDGRIAMAGRDTLLTLCDETDRGFISFTDGLIQGQELRTESLTITCTNTGATVTLHATYEHIGEDRIVERSSMPDGTLASRIVFHRVSVAPGAPGPPPHAPPGTAAQAFEGYWMGVDPVDGGDARRSLVRQAGGRVALAARDTVLTLCDGTDRGFASFDDGEVIDGVLQSDTLTIQCASGASVVLHVRYELVGRGLMLEHTRREDGTVVGTIVLHKVSRD